MRNMPRDFHLGGIVRRNEIRIQGRDNIAYDIAGVSIMDYLDL